ncbi:hypothetical protein TNCV_1458361 [Trichonephila clavipes]|nr:hypothetical protein TNCV_1458361 [Trichonephila clavipes]
MNGQIFHSEQDHQTLCELRLFTAAASFDSATMRFIRDANQTVQLVSLVTRALPLTRNPLDPYLISYSSSAGQIRIPDQDYNMLTKYQMIKFINFCEVWFLSESVARVAAIVGDHRCRMPRH